MAFVGFFTSKKCSFPTGSGTKENHLICLNKEANVCFASGSNEED